MATTLTIISAILLLIGYFLILIDDFKARRTLNKAIHRLNLIRAETSSNLFLSPIIEVEVFDTGDSFIVYRELTWAYPISIIKYDPNDPDDKEYKCIHAEEIAEILNERP